MSPKILTLLAGASLGLLTVASACTVTSSDDDGGGGDGASNQGGAGVGTGTGGAGGTTTSVGGSGTGGSGVGGSEACLGCADFLNGTDAELLPCGGEVVGDELQCEADSECDNFADVYTCACVDDGNGAPGCEAECGGEEDLCNFFVPPSETCQTCLETACAGPNSACL